MKSKDKLMVAKVLGQKVEGLKSELSLVKARDKAAVKVIARELLTVVEELDQLMILGTPAVKGLDVHKKTVERQVTRSSYLQVGLKTALQYMDMVIEDYKEFLRVELIRERERVLKDGIYHLLRKGRVDGEDEVVAVENGVVVWKDSYFREEYGKATQKELLRVIEEAEKISKEVDEDFESTTEEAETIHI